MGMNKQIEELAKQAGMVMYPTGLGITENTLWGDRNISKFAELIIKECDRYVEEHYDECEPWMQPGDLLKHFGVE